MNAGIGGQRFHPTVSAGLVRAVSFVPAALATFAASRLIITHYGIEAFDGFVLAVSLIALMPFNDLGVGSAVESVVASKDPTDPKIERVVISAVRVVVVSGVVLSVISAAMSATGSWSRLLGPASYAGGFFGLCMVLYAFSFVPAVSQGMLRGAHRSHLAVAAFGLLNPVIFVCVVGVVLLGIDGRWVVVTPAMGMLAVSLMSAVIATRHVDVSWSRIFRRVAHRRRFPGASIRAIALPRLIVNLALPLALTTDRVVLSHFSTSIEVARYSVAAQIFAPVFGLMAATAQPLWPIFVAAKEGKTDAPDMGKLLLLFMAGAAIAGPILVVVADPIGAIISGGEVELGVLLPAIAAVVGLVAAASFPVANFMTTPAELRFVAMTAVVALPINITASAVLASRIGAPGPLVATAGTAALVQLVPTVVYIRRHRVDAPAPSLNPA